jgi:hypothetical protein
VNNEKKKVAGAFDVRNVIAALIGLYGLVLVVMGLIGPSDDDLAKTGGVNANLWAGIALVVVAAGFLLWSWIRPIVVEAPEASDRNE